MEPLNRKTANDETFRRHAQRTQPQPQVLGPREASTRRLRVSKPLFCLATVVVSVLTLTTVALADDDKTYVGAQCRPVSAQPPFPDLDPDNGGLFNESTLTQTWICPFVRDEMDRDPPEFARITVIEGTEQVKCTFEARDPKGESKQSESFSNRKVDSILSTSPLRQRVFYTYGEGSPNLFGIDVSSDGYYYFKCDVPGKREVQSGVITYKVSEE
jgi:hypothetical protein